MAISLCGLGCRYPEEAQRFYSPRHNFSSINDKLENLVKQQRTAVVISVCVGIGVFIFLLNFFGLISLNKSDREENKSYYQQPQNYSNSVSSVYNVNQPEHHDKEVIDDVTNIQVLFAKKGYSYCEFYSEYKTWESQANRMDDAYYEKHPDAPGVGAKIADKWLDKKVSHWLKIHKLPDSIGRTISIYGDQFCK